MPKISVIVPVHNVESYIHRCVDSILNQTFADFELILINDGSSDKSGNICDEYAQIDSRVHVIHKESGGPSAARNAGIDWAFQNSNSEWLTFIDSDDYVHSQYLKALYNAAVFHKSDLSLCGYIRDIRDFPKDNCDVLSSFEVDTELFYVENIAIATTAWGKLYKKYLFKSIRYPIGKIHEDTLTTYKILFQFSNLTVLNSNLYFYSDTPNSIINTAWSKKNISALEANENQIAFFRKHKFNKALAAVLRRYIMRLYDWISMPPDSLTYDESKKYKKIWKRKLQKCLIKYNRICSFGRYEWIYETAFPISMRIYYAVSRRLKHK